MSSEPPLSLRRAFALAALFILATACTARHELHSSWPGQPIEVDGRDTEWNQANALFFDQAHLVLTAANDRDNLYLRLTTGNRATRMMLLHSGLTVWLDREGDQNKTFGIRFPVGGGEREPAIPSPQDGQRPGPDMADKLDEECNREAEIVTAPGTEGERISVAELATLGIAMRINLDRGLLVYELRVPLAARDGRVGFRMDIARQDTVGIGLESGAPSGRKPERQGGRGRGPGMGMPPGEGPRGGGMAGGGPDGGGHRPRGERPQPIELWTRVTLAHGPTAPGT